MSIDIDIIKARAKNEYRLSKVRGEAMISVRIPGGILPAHLLTVARDIAETWATDKFTSLPARSWRCRVSVTKISTT